MPIASPLPIFGHYRNVRFLLLALPLLNVSLVSEQTSLLISCKQHAGDFSADDYSATDFKVPSATCKIALPLR